LRSEERFGIIYVLLLLLWGTLITEPLRVFTEYFYDTCVNFEKVVSIAPTERLGNTIIIVFMAIAAVVIIMLSKTNLYKFIPCACFSVSLVVFLIRSLADKAVDSKVATALIIMVAAIGICHLFKLEQILLWLCDICAYSLSVFITVGLIFKPLAAINDTCAKVFYCTRFMDYNLADCYQGFITAPALVWGIFLGILLILPQVYLVFLGRRG